MGSVGAGEGRQVYIQETDTTVTVNQKSKSGTC